MNARCFLCTSPTHTPSTHEAFTVTGYPRPHNPDPPTYFREMVPAVQSARVMVAGHPEWGVEVEVVVEGEGRVFLIWGADRAWWFVSTTGQRRAVLREAEVMV